MSQKFAESGAQHGVLQFKKELFLLNCIHMLPYLNNILVTKLQICEQCSYVQCLAMIIEEDGKLPIQHV